MLRDQTEHLGISIPLEALLSAEDLALFCGQNPIALLGEIRRSDSAAEVIALLKLTSRMVDAALAGAHDVDDCCHSEHEVMRALTEVCVRMATADAVASCWPTFGASARRDLTQPALPTGYSSAVCAVKA